MERCHAFKLGLAILFCAACCSRLTLVTGLRSSRLTNQIFRPEDYAVFYQGVDGTPGVDFPVLSYIPRTTFNCDGFDSGYYADLDTDCQVFHICEEGKKISFLCPNGTIFEQGELICEWWYKVNCTNAPNLYQESAEILRNDIALRKASRRTSLTGQERNHGAVMRIEESASVSAQQNGKPYQGKLSSNLGHSNNNLIQNAISNEKPRRFNDADTGNFINQDTQDRINRVSVTRSQSRAGDKQVYTRSTTPASLSGFSSNLDGTPLRKQSKSNTRGSIKFNGGYGDKTSIPSDDDYDPQFPKHRSEIADEDFIPNPSSGRNTVKIDSSKVDLGPPKQKSSVSLTRNEILNKRLEPSDSDELQITQETAAFAPNTYNSLQSARKSPTSAYSNHRTTYSELKQPTFTPTKFVNTINSVTPQYITTQSINNGKPFVGSTIGGNTYNRNSGRTKQNEGTTVPISTSERPGFYIGQPIDGSRNPFGATNDGRGSASGSTQQNEGNSVPITSTGRPSLYTGQPIVISNSDDSTKPFRGTTDGRDTGISQQNEGNTVPISTTQRSYTGQPTFDGNRNPFGANIDTNTYDLNTGRAQQNEGNTIPISTTERSISYSGQSIGTASFDNSGKLLGGSTINTNTDKTTANEDLTIPTSTTESAISYTGHSGVSASFKTTGDFEKPFAGSTVGVGVFNRNIGATSGDVVKPFAGSIVDAGVFSGTTGRTQEEGQSTVFSTTQRSIPYTGQPVASSTYKTFDDGGKFILESIVGSGRAEGNEGIAVTFATTDKSVAYTGQPVISSTYDTEYSSQSSSASLSGLSSTISPSFESKTTRTVDHATVYGSFSKDIPTTVATGGVEVKLGKNANKVKIQLSKSLGGGPVKYSSTTASPILASDGFVRISGGLPKPVNLGSGTERGSIVPSLIQTGTAHIGGVASTLGNSVGTVGSTLVPNILTIPEGITFSTVPPLIRVTNFQSSDLGGTETGTVGNVDNSVNTATPTPNVIVSQNDIGSTISTNTLKPNINTATGNTISDNIDGGSSLSRGTASTISPNIQESLYDSTRGSQSTTGDFERTVTPNIQGSRGILGSIGGNKLVTIGTAGGIIPNIAVVGSTSGRLESTYNIPSSTHIPNVFISEKSKNTVSPPTRDYSTISSVAQSTNGLVRTTNDTGSHANTFRQSFYPRPRVETAKPSKNGKTKGYDLQDNSFQSTPKPTELYTSPASYILNTNLPSGSQTNGLGLSPNDIGSTLSPLEEFSTYRSSSSERNAFITSTSSPFGNEPASTTTTGFYVTRNSIHGSTTPAPFGLSQATPSGYTASTPIVNIRPNSGEGNVKPLSTSTPTDDSILKQSETRWPRPFQKTSNSVDEEGSPIKSDDVTGNYLNYEISSARPFEPPKNKVTPAPTIPTPFTTARSVQQNVDNMINALTEIVDNTQDYSSETPRPGLIVPPSAGPQTLHTLAQYFANALDGIVAEKENETGEELDKESKEKLTSLLTQMTMYRYNQLFKDSNSGLEDSEETTTASIGEELVADDSNNLVETPQLRELARNFSVALSSYLSDPAGFRKELETFRPTEPPSSGGESVTGEEELLNFSDADSKSSFPPLFTTPQSPSPTWGYIIAPKDTNDLDVKNSLNPDLHTADTQSFVPGFNSLPVNVDKGSEKDSLVDHWTASPGVTKLWRSTLSVNPIIVNENLGSTRPLYQTTQSYIRSTTPVPLDTQSEIQYDLRSLPPLSLNSTQVHGILIDFVNTTKTDDTNRLQRLLKKLNTTEDEFVHRMKEIESNPLTKRLILLLISECGVNVTKNLENDPLYGISEILNASGTHSGIHSDGRRANSDIPELVEPSLREDDQDTRALQLLNSLYAIASKFGK